MSAPVKISDGFSLIERTSVGSTNDEAVRLAQEGAADGTVVRADRQEAGRGRRGRRWHSPEGNLYCSIVMRPAATPAKAAQLSLVAAVALAEAVCAALPPERDVRQKWPNDVLVDGAKVAGILLESAGSGAKSVDWVVVGCGVNLAEAPDETDYPATSLRAGGASALEPRAFLSAFLHRLRDWRARWETEGVAAVRDAWLARAHGLGERITVRLPDRELHGVFAGMDDAGGLLLETTDGARRVISAGDVFFT